MKFSQRIGKTPLVKEIQLDGIDSDLKNGLWDIYNFQILENVQVGYDYEHDIHPDYFFSYNLWHNFFKIPADQIPVKFDTVRKEIRKFFFTCEWYKLYDLIEITIDLVQSDVFSDNIDKNILQEFNKVFEREFSGFRFIDNKLSPITNSIEIQAIEESLTTTENLTSLSGCNTHLKSALNKLSDRINPDYRNSIKESISSVESLAKILSDNSKDSLSGSLDKIKGRLGIHPALERGFKQIYGYTSDAGGIRHAMTEDATCDFEDAKFMLVSCSAFINYLIMKAQKVGISFLKEN